MDNGKTPIIQTKRLLLREMESGDFDALYAVLADSDIMQHYPYTFDAARVHRWIDSNMERYRVYGFGLWAVCLRSTGEMIGDCGLSMQAIDGTICPEIGYHIARAHQRQGYAKEAARACRDWAFTHTPLQVLYSYMKAANEASRATAQANGMRLVRTFTDAEGEISTAYAVTHAEWQADQSEIWERLYRAALAVQKDRKVSNYIDAGGVAAAIQSASGKIYTGVCVDTCSTLGICAERNAIFNMLANGEDRLARVLAVMPDGKTGAPCGACRELMVQLMPEDYAGVEIMLDYTQKKVITLGELTPEWWI